MNTNYKNTNSTNTSQSVSGQKPVGSSKKFALKKTLAFIASGAIALSVWQVSSSLIGNGQFARAEPQVSQAQSDSNEPSAAMKHAINLAAAFKDVTKLVDASVVQIDVSRKSVAGTSMLDQFRRSFPDRDGDGQPDVPPGMNLPEIPEQNQQGEGSGFVIDHVEGFAWIATNNHVAGDATTISVRFSDGKVVKGDDVQVVGTDPRTDVALLKVKIDKASTVKWGDSNSTERGDLVLAFGSPFGYTGSVSQGIVSAIDREVGILQARQGYENFIQTDAAINPGNSGGPLVNMRGEVIGINTAIASRTGGFSGVGFAIPSNQAKAVIDSLRGEGRVVRGYLGVMIQDISANPEMVASLGYKEPAGVIVSQIPSDSPAKGKLEPGDIVTRLNTKPLTSMRDLRKQIADLPPRTDVTLHIWRDGEFKDVQVTLGELPEQLAEMGRPLQSAPESTQVRLGVRINVADAEALKEAGLPEGSEGVAVAEIVPGSIAQQIGLEEGDVITQINDASIKNPRDVASAVTSEALKTGLRLRVASKDGKKMLFYKSE